MKKCPLCAEEIQDDAIKCRYCGETITALPKRPWYFRTSTIIIGFLSVGPFILPLVWFNPHLKIRDKIIYTIIFTVISYYLIKSMFGLFKQFQQIMTILPGAGI